MNRSGHKPFQPFLILFLCASLLLLLSSSDHYLRSVNKDLKRFQLFSDIVKTKRYSPLAHSKSHLDFIQKDTSKFEKAFSLLQLM
ncbi:MAG: hypothetical protein ACOVPB_03105, partial [Bacteroidia bacterium]